jgi:adhesin/invasin
VTVLDTHGDPMAGLVVVIDATGQGNVIVQPVNPTDAAGQTTGFVASTHAEAKIVGAAVTTTAGIVPLAATDSVTFVGDPSTISATLSAATASPALGVVANAVDASTITVTVADAFGNPVPGQSVLLASSGSNHVLTQPAGPTDAAGTASGTITSTLAETKTITATINAGPSQVVVTQQPTVEFIATRARSTGTSPRPRRTPRSTSWRTASRRRRSPSPCATCSATPSRAGRSRWRAPAPSR